MAPPRALVAATPVQPYRFGLESVLTQRGDGRWEIGGVDIPSDACGSASLWPGQCSDTAPPAEKTVEDGLNLTWAVPFVVYTGFRCKMTSTEEVQATALARLALTEPRAVEEAFWLGDVAGNAPSLKNGVGVDVLTPAASLLDGIAALEEYLGANYAGTGVIHAPRGVAIYAAKENLLERQGTVLRTPLDTMWAFGAGYDGAEGPDGEAAASLPDVWLYATGAVARWRGEVITNPEGPAALDRVTNEVTVIAERQVMLARDCLTAAVKVSL